MQRWVSFRIHFRIFSWVWNSKILKKLSKIIFQNSRFFLSIEIGIFKNFKIHIVLSEDSSKYENKSFGSSKIHFSHFHSTVLSCRQPVVLQCIFEIRLWRYYQEILLKKMFVNVVQKPVVCLLRSFYSVLNPKNVPWYYYGGKKIFRWI